MGWDAFWHLAQIDVSGPTLAKYAVLLVSVIILIWGLGHIYRGEIQNTYIPATIVENNAQGSNRPSRDSIQFARRTMDIKTSNLSAHILFYHRFSIIDGEKTIIVRKRVHIGRTSFRLLMRPNVAATLPEGGYAFHPEVAAAIRARGEYIASKYRQSIERGWMRRIGYFISRRSPTMPELAPGEFYLRVKFPSDPWFLLFRHPDREVKATGWLTLLTSFFAIFAQFLFKEPARPAPLDGAGIGSEALSSRSVPTRPVVQP